MIQTTTLRACWPRRATMSWAGSGTRFASTSWTCQSLVAVASMRRMTPSASRILSSAAGTGYLSLIHI
eukprot:6104738-Lingulodinium_polyedra.AAC.1